MGTRIVLPQFVAQLVEVGARELRQERGLSEGDAQALMVRIAGRFCDLNPKRLVYVPGADLARKALRNAQIYAEWAAPEGAGLVGRPYSAQRVDALSERNDITPQQVYTILRDQRALRRGDAGADAQLRELAESFNQGESAAASTD